jgi:hypothetical protein
MPFVAEKRARPSALSRPRGLAFIGAKRRALTDKRADRAQGLARKGREMRQVRKTNLRQRMFYISREAAGHRNWREAVPKKMS